MIAGMYFKVGCTPFVSQFVTVAPFTPSCCATCRWSSFSVSRLRRMWSPTVSSFSWQPRLVGEMVGQRQTAGLHEAEWTATTPCG